MTRSPDAHLPGRSAEAPGSGAGGGRDVALVATFAALIVVLSLVPAVPVGAAGVPISLQTLGVMLAALVLGPWRGLASVAVYVALGAAGLPVFAQGAAGLGVLAGPTAGYIFGWFPGAVVAGVVALLAVRRTRGRLPLLILAAVLGGVVLTYLGGWLGLMLVLGLSPVEAVVAGVLPYLPGDGIKVVVAAFVAASVHRAFPDVLVRRAGRRGAGGDELRPYATFEGVGLRVDGVDVLRDVSVSLAEPRVALVGANGSGKSTLLRCLNALAAPTSGRVLLDLPADGTGARGDPDDLVGVDPARSPARARAVVGFVFTDPDAQVVMPTPAEDVALSLRRLRLPVAERDARVAEALAHVGLADRAAVSVHELSSGQRQLLAVAAVLATAPRLLVMDEPTTLLDLRNTRLLRRTVEQVRVPVVVATHDLDLAAACDRVLVVDGGRVVADDAPGPALARYRTLMADG